MKKSLIQEDFLYYLWRTKKIPSHHLVTTDGRALEIIDFGIFNPDSGPDFFNARIRIDNTIWAGNVEMHVFSSDWKRHKHHYDKAYDNVILHVVYEHDTEINIENQNGEIAALALKGAIPKYFLNHYLELIQSTYDIPCQKMVSSVTPEKTSLWKYTLMIERLEEKATLVKDILKSTGEDWEETLYILLARYFGSRVNTEPFELLARQTPLSLINKNKDKKHTIEALVFGQAGMLMANYTDEYFMALKMEYLYLQGKYQLKPMNPVIWKFSKLRPVNFPTVRIAQFTGLMYQSSHLFSHIKEAAGAGQIKKLFSADTSEYWLDHYRFGKEAPSLKKTLGSDFIDVLIINAVSPLLYYYGKYNDDVSYIEKAIQLLEEIPGEKNKITGQWKDLGLVSKSAFDSQALIHLKNNYCKHFKCLSCQIGHEIMNNAAEDH